MGLRRWGHCRRDGGASLCTYLACVGRAKSAENSIAKEIWVHGIEPLRVPKTRFAGFHPGVWQGNKCGVESWEIC